MFTNLKHLHFLGICGTAMGSVAAALRDQGYTVTGSDEDIYPPMSTFLEEKDIGLNRGYRPENLPEGAELIVVGNAIRRGNPEVEEVLNRKLPYCSLPEVLKFFFLRGRHNLVVSGTHGKTTTTSLLAWLLESAGLAPGFMIGGLPNNLGQGARFNKSEHYVIEGDEYDTAFFDKRSKFVHYLPELLVINNIEFDHADIYKNVDEIKLSFRRVVNIVPSNGLIVYNADDANCVDVVAGALSAKLPVGLNAPAGEGRIEDIRYETGASRFRLFGEEFATPMMGEFNVRNCAMAVAAARFYKLSNDAIRTGLMTFAGVRRRQELRGVANGIKVVDDFGHHPTAIHETPARPAPAARRGRQDLGAVRAAFQLDAARRFPGPARGGVRARGRRGDVARRQARTDSGSGTAQAGGRRGRDPGQRQARVLRRRHGIDHRPGPDARASGRHDRRFQQRRFRRNPHEAPGATGDPGD